MANNLRFGVVGLGMGMNRSNVIHEYRRCRTRRCGRSC